MFSEKGYDLQGRELEPKKGKRFSCVHGGKKGLAFQKTNLEKYSFSVKIVRNRPPPPQKKT